jgi:electron transfer flavoprotein alpha subunit
MSGMLIFSDKDQVAYELLSKSKELKAALWQPRKENYPKGSQGLPVTAVILGKGARERAAKYFAYGAENVYISEADAFNVFYTDVYADAICQIADTYGLNIIVMGSTRRGKDLAGRVAQKMEAGCATDIIDVELKGRDVMLHRYMLGGNTVTSELIKTPKKVFAVMPKAFALGEKQPPNGKIVEPDLKVKDSKYTLVERKEKVGESVNLEDAQTLVCVGRGLDKKEDLSIIEDLAKALKGEIGCSRPLSHEVRWLPEDREVGLSGKKCKPSLCFSVGISGQIQHTVGIRDSKIIAAINKDKNAPIFKMADYGIVGDLYEVIPKIVEEIGKL